MRLNDNQDIRFMLLAIIQCANSEYRYAILNAGMAFEFETLQELQHTFKNYHLINAVVFLKSKQVRLDNGTLPLVIEVTDFYQPDTQARIREQLRDHLEQIKTTEPWQQWLVDLQAEEESMTKVIDKPTESTHVFE